MKRPKLRPRRSRNAVRALNDFNSAWSLVTVATVATVVVVAFILWAVPRAHAQTGCSWEWGGQIEAVPEPCVTTTVATTTTTTEAPPPPPSGSQLEELDLHITLGLGLLVFLAAGTFAMTAGRRG